jgi:hypothetical protein
VDAATRNEHHQGPPLWVETQALERKFVPRVRAVAFDWSLPMFCSKEDEAAGRIRSDDARSLGFILHKSMT